MRRSLVAVLMAFALSQTGAAQPSDSELQATVADALHFAGATVAVRDLLACARVGAVEMSVYDARSRSTLPRLPLAYWTLPALHGWPGREVPVSVEGVRGALELKVVRHSEQRYTLNFFAEHCGTRTLVSEQSLDGARRHHWTWRTALLAVTAEAFYAASRDREVRDLVRCNGYGRAPAVLIGADQGLRIGVDVADHIRLIGPTTISVPLTTDARSVSGLRIHITEGQTGDYSVRFSGTTPCGTERLLKVARAESGAWVGAWIDDTTQSAPECIDDEDCVTWRSVASESQCPASRICQPRSMTWVASVSAWASSSGRCTVGRRCLLNADCPTGLVCDVSESIYYGITGDLLAPVCRTELGERVIDIH